VVIPLSPIDRRPNYRWETPPPNILRDTSPSGRGWKAPPDPVTVVDAFDPSTGVSAYLASRFKSLVEFVGYYNARNMSPVDIRTRNQQENSYALEAASALGHRDVVAIILARKSLKFENDTPQFALTTACRYGNLGVVEELTSEKYQVELDLHEVLHEATLGGHNDIVRRLLDRLVGRGLTPNSFKRILMAVMPDSSRLFMETLQRTNQVLQGLTHEMHCQNLHRKLATPTPTGPKRTMPPSLRFRYSLLEV